MSDKCRVTSDQRRQLRFIALTLFLALAVHSSLITHHCLGQPAVKSFITVADMVAANPFQVADPTPSGTRTATVMVQQTAAAYALTNTWSGTNTSTLIASSTPDWAWHMLPLASGPNFYNSDGTLTGPRTVDMVGNSLLWRGPGSIVSSNISSFLSYASGTIGFTAASDVSLSPGLRLLLRTPWVTGSLAHAGDTLTLLNAGTGEVEFRSIPSQATIYSADATIASNRVVTLGGRSLTFKGPGPAAFNSVDSFSVSASQFATISSPGNVILEAPGLLSLRTPNVVGGGAQLGQVLTLNGPNGVVEFATPIASGGSNIYNTDGVISANRIVDTTNRVLTFKGPGTFAVSNGITDLRGATALLLGNTTTIGASNSLQLQTPAVRNSSALLGQVLTLQDATTGRVEYQSPTALPTVNIYNSDGTLSSDRTVSAGGKYLNFTNASKFSASAQTAVLGGSTALQLVTPAISGGSASVGQVPMLQDASTGRVEYTTVTNLYNADGTLTANRTLTGGGKSITFTGLNNFYALDITNLSLFAKGAMVLGTPHIQSIGGTATPGQVLTLQDSSGRVEFANSANPTPINIYNSNGFLTTNRTLTTGPYTLTFDATSSPLVHFFNANQFTTSAHTNVLYADQETQIGGGQRVKFFTPRFNAGAVNGTVLTMVDGPNALVDFHPPYNLYNTNGTLAGNRIVEGNFRELSFTNLNVFDARGRTSTLSGQLQLNVRSPNVVAGTALANQVLTLQDATTGRAEYAALPAPTVDTSVYNTNGSVTGNRSVTVPAGLYLRTIGQGQTILNTDTINITSPANTIVGNPSLIIAGVTTFNLRTPRFYSGQAQAGHVLTLLNPTDALGTADYYAPWNIYTTNGTLTSARTVTGNNFNMIFNGHNIFQASGTSFQAVVGPTGQLTLATPKIVGGPGGPAVAGWVLTLQDASTGRVEYAPLPSGTSSGDYSSIYANDGLITTNLTSSTRTVNFGGVRLLFLGNQNAVGSAFDVVLDNSGTGRFSTTTATNDIFSSKLLRIGGGTSTIINTPGTYANAAARNGWVLAWDGTKSEYVPLSTGQDINIYSTNGTLSGNRTLTGGNFDLIFTNINNLDLRGTTATLGATSAVNVRTPGVASSTVGQVLMAQANGTGQVEFNTPTNIYTADGTISTNRFVTTANGAGVFISGNGRFQTESTLISSYINALSAGLNGAKDASIASQTNLAILTPNIYKGLAQVGQILTLQSTGGTVEYATAPADTSIYNNNGVLSGTRTVTLNNQTLTFQGFGNVAYNTLGTYDVSAVSRAKLQSSGEMDLGGQTSFKVRTPKVQQGNGAVSVKQVLTLNNVDGTVDFADVPTSSVTSLDYHAVVGVQSTGLPTYQLVANSSIPTWGTLDYSDLMHVIYRHPADQYDVDASFTSKTLAFGNSGAKKLLTQTGSMPSIGNFKRNRIVDLVYSTAADGGNGAWIVMNDVSIALGSALTVASPVIVGQVGAVDTASDLASAPLTFKKLSTLGRLAIGDGYHADYYQAAYDPNAPIAEVVRSSVDMARMWRKLVSKP